MLIGACNLTVCPIHDVRYVLRNLAVADGTVKSPFWTDLAALLAHCDTMELCRDTSSCGDQLAVARAQLSLYGHDAPDAALDVLRKHHFVWRLRHWIGAISHTFLDPNHPRGAE